jgi:hypothetical protein
MEVAGGRFIGLFEFSLSYSHYKGKHQAQDCPRWEDRLLSGDKYCLTHGPNCVTLGLNSGPAFHDILWKRVKLQIRLVGIQNKELGEDLDMLNI